MQVRHRLMGAAVLVVSACYSPIAQAAPDSEARQAIQAIYDQQNAAVAHKDIPGLLASLTPDFVAIEPGGKKVTRAQMRQELTQMMAYAQSADGKSVIQNLTIQGNRATAMVKEHAALTLINPQTQQPVIMANDNASRDLWVKIGNTWREKSSQILSQKQTMNGQPFSSRTDTHTGRRTPSF